MGSSALPLNGADAAAAWYGARGLHWVRAGVVIGQAVVLAAAHLQPGQPIVVLMLAASVAVGAAATILGLHHLGRQHSVDDAVVFRQILADLALLTYMLVVSGGPANPFHDAYFVPIAAAAAMLPARQAWTVVAVSLGCYAFVQFVYVPLPGGADVIARALGAGEWITHALLASLAAYFLLRVTDDLRKRERRLLQAREAAARTECALAVGKMAAGAAHELGTPLMTISAVAEDLQAEYGQDPELRARLALLSAGVAECRSALDVLRQGGSCRAEAGACMPVRALIDGVVARLAGTHPGVKVSARFASTSPEPAIVADPGLQQAVVNLLANAAAASPHFVAIEADWTADELTIRVVDRGCGPDPAAARRAGREVHAPRSDGLGLLLTQVTAQRLGGRFEIRNADGGGALAQIVVPLASLRAGRS